MTQPLFQSPALADCLRDLGRPPRLLGRHVMYRRRFCGLTVSMLSRIPPPDDTLLAMLPRGPVVISPDAPAPLLRERGALPLVSPCHLAELDLTRPLTALRAGLGQKWRNRLVRAEGAGLRIVDAPFSGPRDHWLLTADAAQRRARGYRGWPPEMTRAFCSHRRDNSRLFTALDHKDRPIAAMLILRHGTDATYHIGHSTPAGRAVNAHNLLMWRAMSWLRHKGHRRLELGLVETEDTPTLARFKLGTGAAVRRLGGTWLYLRDVAAMMRPLARWDSALMGLDRPGGKGISEHMFNSKLRGDSP